MIFPISIWHRFNFDQKSRYRVDSRRQLKGLP